MTTVFDRVIEAMQNLTVQNFSLTYGKGQYAISGITSEVATDAERVAAIAAGQAFVVPGLYKTPLTFLVTNLDSLAQDVWQTMLESGQVGIYIDKIVDTSQLYMDGLHGASNDSELIDLYFGMSGPGSSDILVEVTDSAAGEINITYGATEKTQLRNLFGQPEGSTMESLLGDGIIDVSTQVAAYRQGEVRFKSNALKTKPFTNSELTLMTEDEEAQGISLSLETVTGSAGVTSTSEYSTGGMN